MTDSDNKLSQVTHILNRNLKKYQRDLLLNPTNTFTLSNIEWICQEILNLPSTIHLWYGVKSESGISFYRNYPEKINDTPVSKIITEV